MCKHSTEACTAYTHAPSEQQFDEFAAVGVWSSPRAPNVEALRATMQGSGSVEKLR